jgi:hypothetical protein
LGVGFVAEFVMDTARVKQLRERTRPARCHWVPFAGLSSPLYPARTSRQRPQLAQFRLPVLHPRRASSAGLCECHTKVKWSGDRWPLYPCPSGIREAGRLGQGGQGSLSRTRLSPKASERMIVCVARRRAAPLAFPRQPSRQSGSPCSTSLRW